MYKMMTAVNTAVLYILKVANKVNPKNSHHKKESFSFFLSI